MASARQSFQTKFLSAVLALCVCFWLSSADGKPNPDHKTPLARRAVIVTTDCGAEMDDQWTLAQLALAPEFELRGIVTTHAPSLAAPAAETSAGVAREVLKHLPLKVRPPVFAGSSVALKSRSQPLPNQGVSFLLQQSRQYSSRHRLNILIIGAATDVASALLIDPTFGDRIKIIAMGFEKWPDGGDSWNVKNDVKAWQVLLESRVPITVGDAAVTLRDLAMTRQHARALFAQRGPAGLYLISFLSNWLDKNADFCQKVTGSRDTWPIWDQVTIAYLLGLTRSQNYPRPTLRDDMRFIHPPATSTGANITWITAIDARRLWNHFTANLDRANVRNSRVQ